ncbi:hypothetical protein EZV61_04815 [Corallincola luteus]|uniref:Uncharacterized protein n=1 Tax=Corallincola luteus TaxID=1775177 RepID=A0ABY2AQ12_9GAMM|nr:hypothetical protein [Corallincola luteus]TCI05283.1 hypothetical protein EZV61_04815 [Corallincola luteus]
MTEFADEYSKPEKLKRVSLYIVAGGIVFITHQQWVFPFVRWYAETAPCHSLFGYAGLTVLWFSLFVGLPLICAFIVGAVAVPLGVKSFADGQYPPKNHKVYTPTKILRGRKARAKSLTLLSLPLFFMAISVWGYLQANQMPQEIPEGFDYRVCDSA